MCIRDRAIGGQNVLPFHTFDAEIKNAPKIGVELTDLGMAEYKMCIRDRVGTMIEIPRAALTADAIANEAEFFSFGTNDLTQMTFGFSRDDAGKFLASYYCLLYTSRCV